MNEGLSVSPRFRRPVAGDRPPTTVGGMVVRADCPRLCILGWGPGTAESVVPDWVQVITLGQAAGVLVAITAFTITLWKVVPWMRKVEHAIDSLVQRQGDGECYG